MKMLRVKLPKAARTLKTEKMRRMAEKALLLPLLQKKLLPLLMIQIFPIPFMISRVER